MPRTFVVARPVFPRLMHGGASKKRGIAAGLPPTATASHTTRRLTATVHHPFVINLYPLTDGEVHSFVEDIIDQQKYINRLITLIDHVMGSSAKGVLLFPDSALPEGFTWQDMKRIWRSTDGILPYAEGCCTNLPQQIASNNTNIGAYELLSLQMRLVEEISGMGSVLQGNAASGTRQGAQLYERQVENATIALADIFETFNTFRLNPQCQAPHGRTVRKRGISLIRPHRESNMATHHGGTLQF